MILLEIITFGRILKWLYYNYNENYYFFSIGSISVFFCPSEKKWEDKTINLP